MRNRSRDRWRVPLGACAALGAFVLAVAGQSAGSAQLLDQAIAAAGGENALALAAVLKWSGKATVYAGGRTILLEGRWIVQPPDRASVATWEIDKGEASTRRLVVNGARGWMERSGQRTPMPADVLAHERDQFYLYSLMRLVPLREPGVEVAEGPEPRHLIVKHSGRPDVEMFFDAGARLVRLRTRITDPSTGKPVVEELALDGAVTAGGIRWPRSIRITWDGAPFFDLDLVEFSIGSAADLQGIAK
jgi:hypothetical protein